MISTKLICITPIKNESWILKKFLTFTSEWADQIIIADQNSKDNSLEIASKFEKVKIIKNEGEYNEFERTKILLNEARKIEGKKIIFALDADEFLSANFKDSPEWNTILSSPPGSIFNIERLNLTPNYKEYFGGLRMIIGLFDDNEATIESTSDSIIHNIRLPWPKDAKEIYLNDIKLLHLDYVNQDRVLSKLRWYQCFEKEKFNHDDNFLLNKYKYFKKFENFEKTVSIKTLETKLTEDYVKKGLDFTSYNAPILWWDDELFELFKNKGIKKFKNLSISHINWENFAKNKGNKNHKEFEIKKSFFKRLLNKIKREIKN